MDDQTMVPIQVVGNGEECSLWCPLCSNVWTQGEYCLILATGIQRYAVGKERCESCMQSSKPMTWFFHSEAEAEYEKQALVEFITAQNDLSGLCLIVIPNDTWENFPVIPTIH